MLALYMNMVHLSLYDIGWKGEIIYDYNHAFYIQINSNNNVVGFYSNKISSQIGLPSDVKLSANQIFLISKSYYSNLRKKTTKNNLSSKKLSKNV